MRCVNDLVQQLVKGRVNGQQIHARSSHHGVTCCHVCHANHALEHEAALGIDDLVVFGFDQRLDELVFGVGAGVKELSQFLEK